MSYPPLLGCTRFHERLHTLVCPKYRGSQPLDGLYPDRWSVFALHQDPLEVSLPLNWNASISALPSLWAPPSEVEEGVTVRIEEAIQDIEGIEKMISTSSEGSSNIRIELENGYDPQLLKDEITTRVEGLNTLPDEVERPAISVPAWQREVISVALAGPLGERELRDMALQIEEDIRALPEVTQAQVEGIRPYELSIEISERTLREFGLTLSEISNIIRRQSLDLSAGSIKTNGGEVLIRTKGQAYVKEDYADLVILSRPDGTRLRLGDIATITDDFDEIPIITKFNGQPALTVEVYRIGDQNAITVAAAVRKYIAEKSVLLPEGITLETWRDRSKTVSARLKTLTDSALQGGNSCFAATGIIPPSLCRLLGLHRDPRELHGECVVDAGTWSHPEHHQLVCLHPGVGHCGR